MNAGPGSKPIPRWRFDRDYYRRSDPKRQAHVDAIDIQERINARIMASRGDHSYSVIVGKKDCR